MKHGLDGDRVAAPVARVLSIGSLPPAWGGRAHGGVATLHATLLEGLLDPRCSVDPVGVVPPEPLEPAEREPGLPVFERPPDEPVAAFYQRLLHELEPDAVVMHHFAHWIGMTHARLTDPPPAIGIAHSWHNITFRSGGERRHARAVTEEALSGLSALVGVSRHCLLEGERLGLRYPPLVETIYHPLQPLYTDDFEPEELARARRGVACLGSLIPRKDPTVLVEAAKLLPGLDVAFAGHGELEGSLRALISELSLGDRVAIRDLDDGQVRDLLLGSEVMCLPSRSETFGLAYTEALACGTPVVGFGPTLREIRAEVGSEIGEALDEAVAPRDVAAAIGRVRVAGWDRAELRRRTVEAFDLRAASRHYEELIARVLAGRPARSPTPRAPKDGPDGRGPTVVCVLGMSRSGTSLTARILNLAGVYLGAGEELLGGELHQLADEGEDVVARAREANPRGFWEHYRLMRLNERILRALGGNWREPPAQEPGWERSERLAALREEARALLAESFAGRELWGWKDARNSLTLPFWQSLLPNLRYVICLRNPVDVAASLERRDGIAREDGVMLWRRYLAAALVHTSGQPRLLVSYESYFQDPAGTADRLAGFAGREGALDGAAGERALAQAIDERLWRNRSAASAASGPGRAPREAAALFRVAELLATTAESGAGGTDRAARLHAAADLYAEGLLDRVAGEAPAVLP